MKKGKWATGQIQLSVRGKPLEIQVTVPAKPVKPQRMLPVFQKMTNLFVEIGVEESQSEGREISCKKGCGACCRQPVPLPEFEAYNIAEIVEKMSEPNRTEVKERFAKALAHFTGIGWVEKFADCADYSKEERRELFLDYFREGIACPFLVEESCSIHQDRPIVCREYLVTTPAENCSNPTEDGVKVVKIPITPSKNLFKFGQRKPLRGLNVIPLIMSLEWVAAHPKSFPQKTGGDWLAEFLQNINKSKVPEDSKTV